MHSIAGFIIRTSSFVSKELVEILRQTRLLLALVLGPFLILLLFGVGYRNEARALRMIFVVQSGQQSVEQQVQQYATSLGPQLDFRGIVNNEGEALAQLARNQVDAVVVVPSDVEQKIRKSEQPVVKLYHREIDPTQSSYVQYVAQIYVDELNRRVLRSMAEQGQKEAGTVQEDIKTAKSSAHAMRLAYEAGNGAEAQQQRSSMTQSLGAVPLGGGASLGARQAVANTMGPNQGAGDNSGSASDIMKTLESINANNSSQEKTPTNQGSYSNEAQRA